MERTYTADEILEAFRAWERDIDKNGFVQEWRIDVPAEERANTSFATLMRFLGA